MSVVALWFLNKWNRLFHLHHTHKRNDRHKRIHLITGWVLRKMSSLIWELVLANGNVQEFSVTWMNCSKTSLELRWSISRKRQIALNEQKMKSLATKAVFPCIRITVHGNMLFAGHNDMLQQMLKATCLHTLIYTIFYFRIYKHNTIYTNVFTLYCWE